MGTEEEGGKGQMMLGWKSDEVEEDIPEEGTSFKGL
jgi:hypothetical protein